jgi:cobalt-zinc-cadmium efflux system protein
MALHHHHHHHDHAGHDHDGPGFAWSMSGSAALGVALLLTLGYAGVELVTGVWFASLALVSDAGHMFSDAVALGLAWFAAWLAQRPAGLRHSFGLARAEVIAGFVNGLSMLLIVVLIAVEAIRRLLAPAPVAGLGVLVVAFIGLLLNLAVAFIISRSERNLNTRAALLHVMSDVLGSVVAMVAGGVIYFTGWTPIDPILSLVIALLILVSTLHLLREALHVLMEGVPAAIRLEEVGHALARLAGVRSVHDLHIWNISSGRAALSAHLELATLEQWPQVLAQARALLLDRFNIEHVTLQPELAGMREEVRTAVVKLFSPRRKPNR